MWKVAVVLALLIVAILAGWFFIGEEAPYEALGGPAGPPADELAVPPLPVGPAAAAGAPLPADAAEPPLTPDPGWVRPALNQSDPFVREQLAALGVPGNITGQEELVRRLAVVIENAARGEYPRRQLSFLVPQAAFRVVDRDGRLFVDPANYTRFDPLVDALEAIDPRALARLLEFLMPLVDESLAELGSSGNARSLLAAGLLRVLDVPVVTGDVEAVRPNVFYAYADPALEQLPPLQKLILRTGPGNVQRIQAYLRRLAAVMGIPAGVRALP